jgi:hypothetical protein
MTATATVEVEPQAPEVAELTDDTRKELVALRESGMTLAELKARFPQLTGDEIREVLPPGNARERKAKEAKAKVTEVTQGTGGRSGKAKSEPKAPKAAEPKPEPKPRYAEGDEVVSLSERALACRQVMGRNALAEALDMTGSAVWRAEQGRIHPDEVKSLETGLKKVEDRIAAGEFIKVERQPQAKSTSKADLQHRIEAAIEYLRTGTKGLSGKVVAEATLALLDPPTQVATETQ